MGRRSAWGPRTSRTWRAGTAGKAWLHVTPDDSGGFSYELVSDGSQLVPARTPAGVGYDTSLAVDEHNRAHIGFHTAVNPFFPDDPFRPLRPVYAVDANPPPAGCPGGDEASWAWKAPQSPCTDWHVQAVDHDGFGSGFGVSLALDGQGVPGIAYQYAYRVNDYRAPEGPVVNPNSELRFAEPVQRVVTGVVGDAAGGLPAGS